MKKTARQLIKQAETCKKHLAEERDKLRDILSDLHDIYFSVDDGVRELESAIDTLSQLL